MRVWQLQLHVLPVDRLKIPIKSHTIVAQAASCICLFARLYLHVCIIHIHCIHTCHNTYMCTSTRAEYIIRSIISRLGSNLQKTTKNMHHKHLALLRYMSMGALFFLCHPYIITVFDDYGLVVHYQLTNYL